MNPYLRQLREKYASLRKAIEGIQANAVAANRPITADERASIERMGAEGTAMAAEITMLDEIEQRDSRIAAMEAGIAAATGPTPPADPGLMSTDLSARSTPVGGAQTQDRDPGHYQRASSRGSFFRDIRDSKENNEAATRRLHENARHVAGLRGYSEDEGRALTTASAGTGVIAPKWMTELFAARP